MDQTRKQVVIPNKWKGREMDPKMDGHKRRPTPSLLTQKKKRGDKKKRNDETSCKKIEEVVAHSLMFSKTFLSKAQKDTHFSP